MNAASINVEDRKKLASLLETHAFDDDDFEGPNGAPKAAAYESHSSTIIDTLAELKVKAETERAELRSSEMTKKHNFEMLAQSLTDQVATQNADLRNMKSTLSQKSEAKGIAQGTLSETQTTLSNDEKYLADLQRMCEAKSAEWEQRQKGRATEISTIEKALSFIQSDKFIDAAERRIGTAYGEDEGRKWTKVYRAKSLMQVDARDSVVPSREDV